MKSVGVDIVSIARIEDIAKRIGDKFIKRCFTQIEIEYCENIKPESRKYEQYAVRFAAKEAVSKALGTGIVDFNFRDVEVVNLESGKPVVKLHNNAYQIAQTLGIANIQISLSHEDDKAIAFVIVE
ncbi:MAG: holo-ACP synthase [Planctomycetes bacterium]|nr:holo-ACP synthase [Planctomycetota bacterium]